MLDKDHQHNIGDDLESFVHVLTWAAIKYARNALDAQHRTQLLKRFDSSNAADGGREKQNSFQRDVSAIKEIKLAQKQFSAILSKIYIAFGIRYESPRTELMTEEALQAEVAKLETHEWLLDILETALEDDEWKAAKDGRVLPDVIVDPRHLTAGQAKRRKSMLPDQVKETDEKRAKKD